MAAKLSRLSATSLRQAYSIRPRPIYRPSALSRPFHASRIYNDESAKPPSNSSSTPPPNSSSEVAPSEAQDIPKEASKEGNQASQARDDATSRVPSSDEPTSQLEGNQSASEMIKPKDMETLESEIFKPISDDEKPPSYDALTPEERAASDRINAKLAELADRSASGTVGAGAIDEVFDLMEREAPPERRAAMRRIRQEMAANEAAMAREAAEEEAARSPPPRVRPGFLAMGEDDEMDEGEDEVFEGNEMTSTAHGELEQHRELREYARIAAWEMPMLSKLTKPFEPPPLDRPLRFRHTTYLGEDHPAAAKVVVQFCTADLPLTPAQRLKLVKLLGPRYDPQTDAAKLSCEVFDAPAQNKRYLGDLVGALVAEVRGENADEEGGKDAFEDVPVDFRHVRWKRRLRFPEAWKMTPERRRVLEEGWRASAEAEAKRAAEGRLVDGVAIIEQAVRAAPPPLSAGQPIRIAGRSTPGRTGVPPKKFANAR